MIFKCFLIGQAHSHIALTQILVSHHRSVWHCATSTNQVLLLKILSVFLNVCSIAHLTIEFLNVDIFHECGVVNEELAHLLGVALPNFHIREYLSLHEQEVIVVPHLDQWKLHYCISSGRLPQFFHILPYLSSEVPSGIICGF